MLRIGALLCLVVAASGAVHAQAENDTSTAYKGPPVTMLRDGGLGAIDLAGKRAYVEFQNSPRLSTLLARRAQSRGAVVVETASEADVWIEAKGEFKAAREYGNRRAHADVGEVFEKAGGVQTTGLRQDVMFSHGGAALDAAQATVVANLLSAVADTSGFRGWFNNLVAGDPDGFCFRGCEYRQTATITLSVRQASGAPLGSLSVAASTSDRKLLPLPLVEAALAEAFGELDRANPSPPSAASGRELDGAGQ
jgi:hypothetical protein